MKNIYIICLVSLFLFTQCTPKVGETVQVVKETPVEKEITFRSTAPKPGPAPRIKMGAAEQFKMDNGLQVIVVENRKLPRVSYQLFIDVPIHTEGEKSGTSELAGQMLNKGTSTRKKSEIDESIDYIGGTIRPNSNGIFAASLKRHNDDLLQLMSDVLLNPSFPQAEYDKLLKQNKSALSQQKDDPSSMSSNVSTRVVYGDKHPYGEMMTEQNLEKIELKDIRNYYETYFKPNISYLVIVGDITVAEAKPIVNKYFGDWKSSSSINRNTYKPNLAPDGTTVNFVNKTGAVQSVINITYPVDMKPGSPDEIKARVMNTWLGAGVYFGNRLNQNLREKNAYTYGAGSGLRSDKEVGVFSARASVRNEVTDSSIVEFFNEFNDIREVAIDEAELQKVKNVLNGAFGRSLENPETIARFALNTARYKLPTDYYSTYLEKLSKVTSADVKAMARKYIRPDNANIVVVGNQDEVADKLARFAKSGKVNYFDYQGNVIEVEDTPISEDVTAETVIADYLQAIGGIKKLDAVKTVELTMKGNLQGMNIQVEIYQDMPGKFASLMSMNGNVMQAEVLNGEKGLVSGMGGSQKLEGDDLNELKSKSVPFSERFYKKNGATIELKGVESIDGKKAYKVLVKEPNGTKTTDYYDIDTALKLRTVVIKETQGQSTTETVDLSDYKEIDGVQFPHVMIINSAAIPMPLKMETTAVKVNGDIDQSIFTIE